MKTLMIVLCLLCLGLLGSSHDLPSLPGGRVLAATDDADEPTRWEGKDLTGRPVKVPADRPTVLVFVMANQDRSITAMRTAQQHVADDGSVQVVAVLSGPDAQAEAPALIEAVKWTWPMVIDPQHSTAGQMKVHAWPTTLVVDSQGRELAHLAGLPQTLARDLDAYLAFALGRLTQAQLEQRVSDYAPVGDTRADEAPSRHLRMIERLVEQGEYHTARQELQRTLDQHPDDIELRIAMIRLLLRQEESAVAWPMIEKLDAARLPAWRLRGLRGHALMQRRELDRARTELEAALELNPQPTETHYLLGKLAEQQERWPDAARHYRSAFETTPVGKTMILTPTSERKNE
jgi:thioredoxin-like negative regulator of GroEL